jgi:hypothetical protein
MFHNLGLQPSQLRFVDYRSRFEEYCARADECQRLADHYSTDLVKLQYEVLAHQWRELANNAAI